MRVGAKGVPLTTALLAILFNAANAACNAYAITHGALRHDAGWLTDPRFAIGVAIFLAGWAINLHSDAILRRLRAPGETGYRIPRGGLYRFVSCPNYLGEIVEWCGWALATWTWAGAVFAFFTFANLFPRALSHHRWHRALPGLSAGAEGRHPLRRVMPASAASAPAPSESAPGSGTSR
jgi:steroid 5-alpha-reductase/3-oxo-5-alpha-steroid 4-dehydrogenase 1